MFLGPGVYENHEKYKSLTKAPCAAVYVCSLVVLFILYREKVYIRKIREAKKDLQ